jgi:hypothetical protein
VLAALITAGIIALAAIAALAVITSRSALASGPSLAARTMVVHTRDDKTIRGVLHAQHADRWTIRDAVLVTPMGEQPAGGLQHIPVANISFAQQIEPRVEGGDRS